MPKVNVGMYQVPIFFMSANELKCLDVKSKDFHFHNLLPNTITPIPLITIIYFAWLYN